MLSERWSKNSAMAVEPVGQLDQDEDAEQDEQPESDEVQHLVETFFPVEPGHSARVFGIFPR